jgi:hypothetical protein
MLDGQMKRKVVNRNPDKFLYEQVTVVRNSITHFIKIEEAHMNLKKTVTIAAAAGALAAISVPAMAFENEFHGIYNFKTFFSNYENGGTANIDPTQYRGDNKMNNFTQQRARLQYIAKANDDLKLVTHLEMDANFGGDKTGKYGVSSDAGTADADGIAIEVKHVFLDFNLGKSVNVKTGIQPVKDSVKGIFFDEDAAGILATTSLGSAKVGLGYFRLATETSLAASTTSFYTNASQLGHQNKDLFALDAKFAANKNITVGGAYYLLADYTANANSTIHMFDVNAEAKVGPATISGFFAAQTGYSYATGTTVAKRAASGYAANIAAKAAVGPGTLKTAFLYTSGDGKAKNNDNSVTNNDTSWKNSGVVTYVEGGMFLLSRTGVGGTTNDRTIIGTTGAGQKGVWLATMGYDANLTPKLYANANLGMAWAAKNLNAPKDRQTGLSNASNLLGTEINLETGYKVYDNLTAKVQLAYVFLGGYYKGSAAVTDLNRTPENPYTTRVGLSYAF